MADTSLKVRASLTDLPCTASQPQQSHHKHGMNERS